MNGRIDLHTHFVPDGYRAVLARHGHDMIAGTPVPDWSAELHQEFMRRWGIATAVVSISDPGVYFGDTAEARETARVVNEEAAALIAADRVRWGAFASLPLPDVPAAAAELEHALDALKLDGVALLSNVDGIYLGDSAFADLRRAPPQTGGRVRAPRRAGGAAEPRLPVVPCSSSRSTRPVPS